MKTLKVVLWVAVLVVALVWVFAYLSQHNAVNIKNKNGVITPAPKNEFCFFSEEKDPQGPPNFSDKQVLRFRIGTTTIGRYEYLPAGKDSKRGNFVGTTSPFKQGIEGRIVTVIWDAMSEGIVTQEELLIQYTDDSAVAFLGTMIHGKDRKMFVYADKDDVQPGMKMDRVDCSSLK
jgi:hypothetical protein